MSIRIRPLPAMALLFAWFGVSNALAEASAVELDAAVARVASAAYKIEVLSVCGFPKSNEEKVQVQLFAMAMALQPEGLSKKLTTEQFVSVGMRVRDKEFMASMQARAKQEATPEECAKPETSALWTKLLKFKETLRRPGPASVKPGDSTMPPGAKQAGSPITEASKINALEAGKSTAGDVKSTFGNPVRENHNPDGRFVYVYDTDLPRTDSSTSSSTKGMISFLFGADSKLIRYRVYVENN